MTFEDSLTEIYDNTKAISLILTIPAAGRVRVHPSSSSTEILAHFRKRSCERKKKQQPTMSPGGLKSTLSYMANITNGDCEDTCLWAAQECGRTSCECI